MCADLLRQREAGWFAASIWKLLTNPAEFLLAINHRTASTEAVQLCEGSRKSDRAGHNCNLGQRALPDAPHRIWGMIVMNIH